MNYDSYETRIIEQLMESNLPTNVQPDEKISSNHYSLEEVNILNHASSLYFQAKPRSQERRNILNDAAA